jgi:uncharacterized protein YggE
MLKRFCGLFLLLIFFTLVGMNPAMAQERDLRILSVTGQGREKIPTTLTQVSLAVEVQGKTATEVQAEVAKRSTAVVNFLRSRQVEELQTRGISLQPNFQYNSNERGLVGYSGNNSISFRLPTEQVGGVLDEAVKAGATRIDGVSFTATEEAIAVAQKQALRLATLNAQEQAEVVLGTLKFSAQEVVGISINGSAPPQPRPLEAISLSRADAAPETPVIGGEKTVSATVTLQISY